MPDYRSNARSENNNAYATSDSFTLTKPLQTNPTPLTELDFKQNAPMPKAPPIILPEPIVEESIKKENEVVIME